MHRKFSIPGQGELFDASPYQGDVPMHRALSQGQFPWAHLREMHEDYANAEDMVNWAAHATPEDPEAESGDPSGLNFKRTTVDVGRSSGVKMHQRPGGFSPSDPDYSRVQSARQGYDSGADIPPVLGVRRGGKVYWADGNHRVEAARTSNTARENGGHFRIDAYIANSPVKGTIPRSLINGGGEED